MTQAVIVGGGIVGLAVAHRLLDRGFQVSVVNQTRRMPPASWGNAGHIAVEQVAPLASIRAISQAPARLISHHGGLSLPTQSIRAWVPFSWRMLRAAHPRRYAAGKAALTKLLQRAVPAWQRFAAALESPDLLRMEGHFITWTSSRSAQAGRDHWLHEDIGSASIRDASADELHRLRALAPGNVAGAIRFSGTGQISDPDALMQKTAERLGNRILDATATTIMTDKDGARVTLHDGRLVEGDIVVIAAGVDSRPLLERFGHRVPMIAERGYHVQYQSDRWPAATPPVVFEDRAMIVSRFTSTVRVAGFVEFSEPDSPADPAKWQHLAQNAKELGLPLGEPIGEWMGSRPTLPDYLPAIGRSRRAENLFYAFGHQHLGLTLAPITGELVSSLVSGEAPVLDTTPFDVERFS